MSDVMDTVGVFYEAFERKDWDRLRSVLDDGFTFRGSLARFDGPDAFVSAMQELPFEGSAEGSQFIVDGGRVAHVFVWRMTAPVAVDVPMCEVLAVRDGKVASSELFYDSQHFPSPA